MQIKKPLSVISYIIFLIYSMVFSEMISASGANDLYRLAIIIGLFFVNMFFTIWMNNLDEKVYNIIRVPFIVLWTVVTITFSRIVLLPFSQVLMLLILDFLFYYLFIIYVYRIIEHKTFKEIVAQISKKRLIIFIIALFLIILFILIKTISTLSHHNNTITGYFVDYKQESIHGFDMEYYPTFSYVINGETFINDTDNPMLIRIYKSEKENEVKLLYNEEDTNQIVIKSHVVLNIVAVFTICAGTIAILYVYNKNKFENKNEGE